MQFSTEVTSSTITSDNPLFQRTLKAYHLVAKNDLKNVLEIGCGEGYGLKIYLSKTTDVTLLDKSREILAKLNKKFPSCTTLKQKAPPLKNLKNNTFDTVISFQVIEHIKNPEQYLKEIHRVLKPNGIAYITTPNREKSVARNPWHHKEYNYNELDYLIRKIFKNYTIKGIEGNKKTDQYYRKNKTSVSKILKFDVFNLLNTLPPWLIIIPYEIANRLNRLNLQKENNTLVRSINLDDYSLQQFSDKTLDFYCTLTK